jgi:hydroxybutyrate-dimer hydrolase
LLSGGDLAARQANAKARMVAYGWQPEAEVLQGAHALTNILVAVTYVNAYGRFSVTDRACGFSFANVDASGAPIPFPAAARAGGFAAFSGIIGTPVYEDSSGGAKAYAAAISPSTGVMDQALDGFLCLRSLATGVDAVSGAALTGNMAALSTRVRTGMQEVQATGNLHGKPAIIVTGRSDALLPVNHASRAYVGLNAAVEGGNSKLRYIEVTNANHFDAYSSLFPQNIAPLHVYLFRALDAAYAAARNSATALPPSQVVRTQTRASAEVPLTLFNVPAISANPGADAITVSGTTVNIPN